MKTFTQTRGIYRRGTVYWFTAQKDKKRHWISLHTSDLATAIRKASQLRQSPIIESGMLLKHCVERFVREKAAARCRGAKNGWAKRTADSKIYVLRAFANFCGSIAPARVTADHVRSFYKERLQTRNAQTAYGNYMTIRSFFHWAVEEKLTYENPCLAIKVESPPTAPRRDYCTPDIVRKLIDECPRDDLKYVLYCGFHAGMRALEIVESVPRWFDLDNNMIHMRKTDTMEFKDLAERDIETSHEFINWIKNVYGLREPFMLHPDCIHRRSRYRYDFRRPFTQYMRQQGCEWVTPHIMRHTFASLLASRDPSQGGPSDFEIANWMGIDLRTYQRTYAKLRPRHSGAVDLALKSGCHSAPQ
jgi:integrase